MKDRLIFDTTDANTQADSDSVGAYLRASDGTLLTHTDVGGKKALDVRLAEGVNVEVDLSHVDDSVRLGDGTSFFTSTSENGDIALDVHLSNSVISIDDNAGSITVDATQLDIDDLNATDDAVASWTHDGSGNAIGSTSGSLDVNITNSLTVNDAALADTAIANAANTLGVASTAEDVVASPLANRKYLYIYNNDNRVAYIGASGVTESNGFPVSPSSMIELRAGASVDIEWVSPKVSHEIRTLELS